MPKLPHSIYPIILYKYFACEAKLSAQPASQSKMDLSVSQIRRQHIGYAVFNGIAFPAGLTAKLARYNLLLVLLENLQRKIAFA